MLKRITSVFLIFALVLTLIPYYPSPAEAAWGDNNKNQSNFIFPDYYSNVKVNYKYVSFQGNLINVSPTGITYTVANKSAGVTTQKSSRGITVSEDGTRITIANVELFDGENTITFYGKQGNADVINTYEITYISTPLLYNLQFTGGGKKLPINSSAETFITNETSQGDGVFTIEGNAPNVTQVIIRNGEDSSSGMVTQDSEAYFIVGNIKLNKGKNTLIFYLKNNNQTIEVKRDIIYFDGTGTFYNVKMKYDADGNGAIAVDEEHDLSTDPALIRDSLGAGADGARQTRSSYEGYMIIPAEPLNTSFDPNNPSVVDVLKVTFEDELGSRDSIPVNAGNVTYSLINSTTQYHVYKFNFNGLSSNPALPANNKFGLNKKVNVRFETYNPVLSQRSGTVVRDSLSAKSLSYKFLDLNAPTVSKVEYQLSGSSTFNTLIDGTILNEKPVTVRMTVPNGGNGTPAVRVESVNDFGSVGVVTISSVTPTINGSAIEYVFTMNQLPFDGTQTLSFFYNKTTYPDANLKVRINAAAGPILKFNKLTDGLIFKYDPTLSNTSEGYAIRDNGEKYLIKDILDSFKGKIENVNIVASDYTTADPVTKRKPVTLTVNNTEVKLMHNVAQYATDFRNFTVDGSQSNRVLSDMFHDGQNTVVFRFEKDNIVYEKKMIVTLYSNALPEIPVANTEGVYPFNTVQVKPDPKFVGSNGVYTTKETTMKVAGTFDFIDLGDDDDDVKDTIHSLYTANQNKYLFVIEGPDGFTKTWDLSRNTLMKDSGTPYPVTAGDPAKTDVTGLTVTYDIEKKYFSFVLGEQAVPADGSKAVYLFHVYNNGTNGGSKATFRLEVSAPGLTYKVLRPIKTGLQSTINQNYIEFVLETKNADSVVVNKLNASKVSFDDDLDGDIDTTDAYRVVISDLKPGKSNRITFTIKQGTNTVTDFIDVFYAPSTIPGAQFMAAMKNGGKVFENKLVLTFPKDTYLIRSDYNVPQNLKGQVFKEHNILYAIANSEDGVVDRFDYLDSRPKNFDDTISDLGRQFKNSFDTHFIKASQVYWMDAGMADDPSSISPQYDPYTFGMLPIMPMPNPSTMNPKLYNFNNVPSDRVLVPNKRGTLELAYDPNIVPSAANQLTVMRYDPKKYYWENLGGVVNTSKKTIKVPFDKFGYYVVAKLNDSFRDVIQHPYARNHIEAMFSKGVILSRSAIDFSPDTETTRGEFAAMVVRALQLPLLDNIRGSSFDDVPTDYTSTSLYDYRHIETAARLGIVRGTDPRIFNPQGRITRQEAAVILARALKLKTDTVQSKIDKDLQKLFRDYNLIDNYAKPSVLAIAKQKLIVGSPIDPTDPKTGYVFEPQANILRGDAAILLARVMEAQKTIQKIHAIK
ncbi:S-layer homology domain-containing protein [Brevibacillus dissolubilis]|uniref:S-layer homology domain-containing protein n=1 Tax=Brevibacillus dissolubilis TaxID=1844116 RepID=UPI0011179BE9|nr:S-layer homology domain-containing protein [Brevibacillus dissolubilis]